MRIEVIHSTKQTDLAINWVDSGDSFVNMSNPNIINLSIYAKDKERIFAHELGHIFGFRDCYFEYYNNKKDEFNYYQLDVTNLMCSMEYGSAIKKGYVKKLINHYCRD